MAGVAVVCSMAGVASGLALAATLMAVQIADRAPQARECSFTSHVMTEDSPGWLGVEFVQRSDGAYVRRVFTGTAAERAGLRPGDIIRAVNDEVLDHPTELQYLVRGYGAGAQPSLLVSRRGEQFLVRPMLTAFPSSVRYSGH